MLEELQITTNELIIGLVGAVGSSLTPLTNITKSLLEQKFNYDVEVIKVSKDILANYFDQECNFSNNFEKISKFMDKGNELRKKDHDFIAMQIVKLISEKRKSWAKVNTEKNINTRRVAYIIDSLKHEDEIKALRQIYSNGFFQLSLYESKTARINSLVHEHGIAEANAKQLIDRDEGEKNAYGQHTREAFHLADYFLKFDSNHNELKQACYRFLSIVFQDPYVTPTFNEFATYMSFTASVRSADLSRQVGAVIAKDKNILAIGSNDVPKFKGGTYWPYFDEATGQIKDYENGRDFKVGEDANAREKQTIINDLLESITNVIEKKLDLTRTIELKEEIENVLKNSKIKDITEYGRVVHAEMDALLNCSRSNISTLGATLFVTTFPCHNCAKHILAAGIEKVIFVEPYPKSKAIDMHKESITQKWEASEPETKNKLVFEPFVGVGARSFVNLFSMSLGVGHKLKRKDDDGKIIDWLPETATLRMPLTTLSYRDLELRIIERLDSK
ncbi:anti-phage dCTP deaminase [Acinetobacter shaoyimingii]|uniref:anti-phage dCTP deaminase n=1 Tax=Acinetobacter shaoyimingii TaxID=2715164 RepID=UPI001D0E49AD|nr:anti-phage dCTP deaminase [Acinetobacter shaoyimingii]